MAPYLSVISFKKLLNPTNILSICLPGSSQVAAYRKQLSAEHQYSGLRQKHTDHYQQECFITHKLPDTSGEDSSWLKPVTKIKKKKRGGRGRREKKTFQWSKSMTPTKQNIDLAFKSRPVVLDGIFSIAFSKFLQFQNYSLVLVLDLLEKRKSCWQSLQVKSCLSVDK